MVVAVDIDGTLYDGVEVAPEAIAELRRARAEGHTLIIVTGRRWEELGTVVPDVVALVDRAVCEEGGVLVDVATGYITLLAEPVDEALVDALNLAGVPMLDVGRVVVGAPTTSLDVVTEVRDLLGSSRKIVTNKSSIALTPAGCDKGTELRAAMADLGQTGRPILAIGDAANDLPMFAVATTAIAVANADDAVRASGVPLTTATFGAGAAEALRAFLPRRSAD
jgi:hydroxymethylpyrimidine pyrophosphatase-like HAD family hydrolase